MKESIKRNNGITLIAIITTVIVLLILAGVSINLVFNGEGLFEKTAYSAERDKIAKLQEELELLKTLIWPGTLDDYMAKLEEEKEKYRASEIERLDNEHATVVMEERYLFLIYTDDTIGTSSQKVSSRSGFKSNSSNIIIEYQGEVNTGFLLLSAKSGDIQYPTPGTVTVLKNTTGGKLTVSSGDDSIASASIEGDIITITPKLTKEAEKRVRITVTSEPKGKYKRQIAKYTATIKRGAITIEAESYEGEFDGQKHPALKNVSTDPTECTLTYSLNGGEYQEEIPEVEMTGEYTVSIRAEKEGYGSAEITKTVTIRKQGNQSNTEGTINPNLVLSETSGTVTYPTEETFEVIKNTSGGTLSVSSSDESIASVSINGTTITITPQAITEDGKKATITVRAKATENYEEQTATYEVTVNRGSIEINAVPYTGGTYDGSSHQALTSVTTVPEGCTLEYSLNGGTYETNIPSVTNANTYTVTIKAEKVGYVTKEESKTVTINKQANQSNTEGTTNPNLVLSEIRGTLTYPTVKTITVEKNTSGGELSVTSSDENVARASISGTTITITPQAITEDGKKATITVRAKATENYEEQTATYEATVNRGSIEINAVPYTGGTYDGSSHQALTSVTTVPEGCTLKYSLNGGNYTSNMPTVTNQGTYTITIIAEKSGYITNETTKTIIIEVGKISINAIAYNKDYDGKSHQAVASLTTTPNDCTIKYKMGSTNYDTNPSISQPGNYTVTITATKTGYNSASVTIYPVISSPETPAIGVKPPDVGWTIEQAKNLLERDGLRSHLGEKVDYYCSGGGTWRIFYYDVPYDDGQIDKTNYTNGLFGDGLRTMYLKRDYDDNLTTRLAYTTGTSQGLRYMSKFFPIGNGRYEDCERWCDENSTKLSVQYFDTNTYSMYCNSSVAAYAVGAPGLVMYVNSYNIWKCGSLSQNIPISCTSSTYSALYLKDKTVNSDVGYNVNTDYRAPSVTAGPNGIYTPPSSSRGWALGSSFFHNPSQKYSAYCTTIGGGSGVETYGAGSGPFYVCPIVAILD